MDRTYADFEWLKDLDSGGIFVVTKLKFNLIKDIVASFLTKEKDEHILSDKEITLTDFYTSQKYQKSLRVVRACDESNDKTLALLTNKMSWTADTISQLYKARWDVEIFFKHLKQLFEVKTFIVTSPNTVRIQMCTSLLAILVLNYLKNKVRYN